MNIRSLCNGANLEGKKLAPQNGLEENKVKRRNDRRKFFLQTQEGT